MLAEVLVTLEVGTVVRSKQDWPEWWDWELDCSNSHLGKRMLDRSFNETDLRAMLEAATSSHPDITPNRFVIQTTRSRQRWEIIVEPDGVTKRLIVVTAYPVS